MHDVSVCACTRMCMYMCVCCCGASVIARLWRSETTLCSLLLLGELQGLEPGHQIFLSLSHLSRPNSALNWKHCNVSFLFFLNICFHLPSSKFIGLWYVLCLKIYFTSYDLKILCIEKEKKRKQLFWTSIICGIYLIKTTWYSLQDASACKASAAKSEEPSSIPSAHKVEAKDSCTLLWSLRVHVYRHTHGAHRYTQ